MNPFESNPYSVPMLGMCCSFTWYPNSIKNLSKSKWNALCVVSCVDSTRLYLGEHIKHNTQQQLHGTTHHILLGNFTFFVYFTAFRKERRIQPKCSSSFKGKNDVQCDGLVGDLYSFFNNITKKSNCFVLLN